LAKPDPCQAIDTVIRPSGNVLLEGLCQERNSKVDFVQYTDPPQTAGRRSGAPHHFSPEQRRLGIVRWLCCHVVDSQHCCPHASSTYRIYRAARYSASPRAQTAIGPSKKTAPARECPATLPGATPSRGWPVAIQERTLSNAIKDVRRW